MKEWIALAKVHLARAEADVKSINILVDADMDMRGLNVLDRLEESHKNLSNCLSVISSNITSLKISE